jgi:hypothetical protein
MDTYIPPLTVHFACANQFDYRATWTSRLERWFGGDVDQYALPEPNIPVSIWCDSLDSSSPTANRRTLPPDIAWKGAARSALLVFVDQAMVAAPSWREWCSRQASKMRSTDLLVPCAVTPHFGNLGEAFRATNALRLDKLPKPEREDALELLTTHALARWFTKGRSREKVCLFISHTKARAGGVDARDLGLKLKRLIDSQPIGTRFFDEVDITGGERFEDVLTDALADSVVVVLLTDNYSSRFWCGLEVATAKSFNRPIVVVDALQHGESASLAYLGRCPTIHWDPNSAGIDERSVLRKIVAAAMLEQLRLSHDAARLSAIRKSTIPSRAAVSIAARPLELATLPAARIHGPKNTLVLHADPPVPRYELQLISRQRPDLTLASATQALAGCFAGSRALKGTRVALSISDAPDRERFGTTKAAQERIWTHLATHLFAAGAEVAYGGDLRTGGYTEQLLDLVRVSADAGQPLPPDVVHWYVGWPTAAQLTSSDREAIPRAFRLHEVHPPSAAGALDSSWKATDVDPSHRFAWTLCLRAVRLEMAAECDARVLVGGALLSVSPWPGLLEEFETFVAQGKPVYVAGGLGGAAHALAELLRGRPGEVFTSAFQDEGGARTRIRAFYENRVAALGLRDFPAFDWAKRSAAVQKIGKRGLNNGLSRHENERLFSSRNGTEIVALVLKGLRRALLREPPPARRRRVRG